MKLNFLYLLGLLFCLNSIYAQDSSNWDIETSITPLFVDFSNNENYLVLENEKAYEVWNTNTQSKVLSGTYRNKLGRSFPGVYLTEGSAYLLFEDEDIFLQIDYTLNFTKVDAFDLKTGEMIWSLDNLDMELSTVETLYQIAENAQRFVQSEERVANAAFTATTGVSTSGQDNKVPVSYVGHDKTIKKLISYMPERSAIAVNGKEALQLLDLRTGKMIWEQPELKGAIGELFYEPNTDVFIAVRVNHGEFNNIVSRPEVQALNATNGNLIWTLKYNGDFTPGIAYVINETLVLPYYGLMLIDMATGQELEGDIKEGMKKQRKIQRNMSVLGSEGLGDNCSLPVLDDDGILHYVVGFAKGKHINPDGNKKAYLQIDVEKGEIISAEEDIAKQSNRVIQEEFTEDLFYLKLSKGLSSSYILALDTNTGEIVFETDKIKNRLGTDYDPFLLSENRIIDISSKGIHIYDSKSGKEVKMISYKTIEIGKFKNQLIFEDGSIVIGTKGVAIIDNKGEIKQRFKDIDNLKDVLIYDDIWILETDRLLKIETKNLSVQTEIQLDEQEQIYFSPLGNYTLKVNSTNNTITAF